MSKMENTLSVVTGGAGHLGLAISKSIASEGGNILIVDKDEKRTLEALKQLPVSGNQRHSSCVLDLGLETSFDVILKVVQSEYDGLDYLVNNAAFYDDCDGWGVPYLDEGYEAWEKVMRINLLAPFFLTQKLTDLLRQSDQASVVNIGSIYNLVGPNHNLYEGTEMTNPAAYSASKGGLLQTTRWLSTVLAPDVRVNMVSPGGIERGQDDAFMARYIKNTPLKRMATETDVAAAVLYLLSSDASYVTGQNLVVDGGWSVW